MSELQKVEDSGLTIEEDKQYYIDYQRTVKDINDADVTIPSGRHLKTEKQIQEEIDYWTAQRTNCDNQIVKLQLELSEISKLNEILEI